MATSPTPGSVVFHDDFLSPANGSLNSSLWTYNVAKEPNNPAYLDQTFFRQELPKQADGAAQIRLDTYIPPNTLWAEANTPNKVPGQPGNNDKGGWNRFLG